MKQKLIVSIIMAFTGLWAAGCSLQDDAGIDINSGNEEEPICGGVTDNTDESAPKTIDSEDITSFSCWFSTLTYTDTGIVGNHVYNISANLENGKVNCEYEIQEEGGYKKSFVADDADFDGGFMTELYGIVDNYDIAQYNGINYEIGGLPPESGCKLNIDFDSGENIYCYDNQENHLPIGFLNEVVMLFERGAAEKPEVLDFSFDSIYNDEGADHGSGFISYPRYTLGYYTSEGEQVLPDGYTALAERLDIINKYNKEKAEQLQETFDGDSDRDKLYSITDAFVTRNDSTVLALYEKHETVTASDQKEPDKFIYTYNIDAKTGDELYSFQVFGDTGHLSELIITEIENKYPDTELFEECRELLKDALDNGHRSVSFVLGYGYVHFFIEEYFISDQPGGYDFTLSYVENPGMVRPLYEKVPDRYLTCLEYDRTYWKSDVSIGFEMHATNADENMDVTWQVEMEGIEADTYEEILYGYRPECCYIHTQSGDYIYMQVPVGDVQMLTNVYSIDNTGVSLLSKEPYPASISHGTSLNPDWMKMTCDNVILADPLYITARANYKVGDDGLPEMMSGIYDLDGPQVLLKKGGRYYPDSEDNASVSGGMWTLIEGEKLKPYQSDLESWIHFVTEDNRVVRFEIDEYSNEMLLNGDRITDLFKAQE